MLARFALFTGGQWPPLRQTKNPTPFGKEAGFLLMKQTAGLVYQNAKSSEIPKPSGFSSAS